MTAALLVVSAGGVAMAQAKGGYTAAQAERGTKTFNTSCSICHGEGLGGGPGTPPLAGPEFMFTWKAKTAAELYDYVKANMPPAGPGSLSDQQYADVVAVILKANDHPAGDAELTPDAATQKGVRVGGP